MKTNTFPFGIIVLSIAFISLALSCQNGNHKSSDKDSLARSSGTPSLKEQIMTIHDETMGKIAPLRSVEDSIRQKIKVYATEKKDTMELSQTASFLNHCDTAMFGWMGRYHDQTISADSSDKALLTERLRSLMRINDSMDSLIQKGRMLLH